MTAPPDIFLSYNREDQARAKLFADGFTAQGFSVWWDSDLKAGEAYDEVTETALRTAKAVVVLWSPRSVVSRWVRAEATLADRNKTLVPCMIEPCERPIMFELTQTAELTHWKGNPADPVWSAFLADVTRFVKGAAAPPAAPVVAKPRIPERGEPAALAVLPFTNRSGLAEDEDFAETMVEDIVASLAFSPDLKVLAASATAAWRGKAVDLGEVGKVLSVRYLLEGNVRRVGETLRVTAQLIEAETGAVLWMQRFDRPLAELAALQDALVTEVAGNLHVQVRILESRRALNAPGDLSIHQMTLRAEALFDQSYEAAVAEALRVVEMAPDHGPALAVLASATAFMLLECGGDDPALRALTQARVNQALSLAKNFAPSLWRCASAQLVLGHTDEARHNIDRVMAMTPDNPMVHFVLALILIRQGRGDEVIASVDAWDRLAPGSRLLFLSLQSRAMAHFQAGRLAPAIEAIDHSARLNPREDRTLVVQAALKHMAGDADGAKAAIRALRGVEPDTTRERFAGRNAMLLDPKTANAINTAFLAVWDDTPVESAA
ncbi:hypothetical protein BH11PSE2_BH11PSE2_21080 [soil metagenome]